MTDRTLTIDGVRVPRFLYGTAWKEDETRAAHRARAAGGLPRHRHREPAPALPRGRGRPGRRGRDRAAASWPATTCSCRPSSPSVRGQDHRLPYDPGAPIAAQVEQSFASSLEHLGTEVIDSYVLHGPTQRSGLAAGRLGGLAGDGGAPRQRPGPPARREQRHPRTARAPVPSGARPAPLRAEPLLRRPRLGPRRPRVLHRERARLPGLLAADRQPRGAGPSRAGPDRRTPRPDRRPGRLPVRPRSRHDAAYRHHRPRPHAGTTSTPSSSGWSRKRSSGSSGSPCHEGSMAVATRSAGGSSRARRAGRMISSTPDRRCRASGRGDRWPRSCRGRCDISVDVTSHLPARRRGNRRAGLPGLRNGPYLPPARSMNVPVA